MGCDFLSDHLVAACCRVKARVGSVGDISRALEQELLVSTHLGNRPGSLSGEMFGFLGYGTLNFELCSRAASTFAKHRMTPMPADARMGVSLCLERLRSHFVFT